MPEQKIALITGGAQGIGLACAQALFAEGHKILLADVDQAGVSKAAQSIGNGTCGLVCDMGDSTAIQSMIEEIETVHGPVSILVNNAGVAMPGDFMRYSLEDFRKVLDINLIGAFAAMQRVARTMIGQGIRGAIVNMTSINAQVAIPAIPAYCASKGGLMQVTKAAAIALAPHGIRVNAVGPGSIDTAMMASVNANPEAFAKAMSRTPLGRAGTAREVGDVVAFLAGEKASYITGETIYVDGGRLGLNYTM